MIEDNLTHDERLRLECIAQAVAHSAIKAASPEQIVQAAKEFEDYIKQPVRT